MMILGKIVLRDYQQTIIDELKFLPSSALYMGTGTGKTITSLELVKHNPTDKLLVVCPHNAITQWKRTINEHFNYYTVVEFKKSWTSKQINAYLNSIELPKRAVIVINYDMIHRIPIISGLVNNTWTVILDEMHRIKSYGTKKNPVKATHYLLGVGKKTEYKIGLTATPTQGAYGGYIEYYTQLAFLGYTDLSYDDFYKKHVIYENKSVANLPFPIKTIIGYRKTSEIDDLLINVAKRYMPAYGDFEPQFNTIVVEKPRSYNRMVREKSYKDIALNNLSRARIAKKTLATGAVSGKGILGEDLVYMDNTNKLDWLRDYLEDVDGRVVVLYNYNVELDSLEQLMNKMGKKYIKINGQTKDKGAELDKKFDVVLGQYQAISEALDGLQYLSNQMVFFSMPESSLLYRQALGRIDRIGQTKVPMYYFLVMEKTLDEEILQSINEKIEFSEKTLNLLEV